MIMIVEDVVCYKKNFLRSFYRKRLSGDNDPEINGWMREIVILSNFMDC